MKVKRDASLAAATIVLGLTTLVLACRETLPQSQGPGIDVRVTVRPLAVAAGGPALATYEWTVAPSAAVPRESLLAFVHFVDEEGTILFTDDHVPEPAPDVWQVGRQYSYTRLLLTPIVPYVGPVELRLGLAPLAGGGPRWPLKAEHLGLNEYRAGRLRLLPRALEQEAAFGRGFGPVAASAEAPFRPTRVMRRRGWVTFVNPKAPALLFLDASASRPPPPHFALQIRTPTGWQATLPLEGNGFRGAVRLPREALGEDPRIRFRLATAVSDSGSPPVLEAESRKSGVNVRVAVLVADQEPFAGALPLVLSALPPQ